MPPRKPATPRDKREELKTYKDLDLRRDLKSARNRKRIEANGLRRVLGNGSTSRPYLIVETRRYLQVRLDIQRRLLDQARRDGLDLDIDLLLQQLGPRIESLAYAQLAEETGHEIAGHLPIAALGRALTTEEKKHFAASRAASESAGQSPLAHRALNQVLGQIEKRHVHNPTNYQTIWAQVVGVEAAQQSYLDQIDSETQTAWFRCTNSALSYDLGRRPALVQKLAKALNLPIRKLRAKF